MKKEKTGILSMESDGMPDPFVLVIGAPYFLGKYIYRLIKEAIKK